MVNERRDITQKQKGEKRTGHATVFLVDEHPIVLQGLAELIKQECDLVICGQAEDSSRALQAIVELKPDVVIAEISLKGSDGIELIRNVKAHCPSTHVLVLSIHDESLYAERALLAGAEGYVMKQEIPQKILMALRRILDGELAVSDMVASRFLQRAIGRNVALTSSLFEHLSNRELHVFRLIGQGRGTRQIAEELHLSVKTVEVYNSRIKKKLGLSNSRELLTHAIHWYQQTHK